MKLNRFLWFLLLSIVLRTNYVHGEEINPKVYLIIANKITLEDIKAMDNVQAIIEEGTIGLMNTKGLSGYTDAQGFLTINASGKTSAKNNSIFFNEESINIKAGSYEISKINEWNKGNRYSPYIGAIGDNLHQRGFKTGIYGNSNLIDEYINLSALIPMDSKGLIDFGNITDITMEVDEYPFNIKTDYTKLLSETLNTRADLVVVDIGDLERIYRYSKDLSREEYNIIRQKILSDIDDFMGRLKKEINLDNSLLMMMSPNEGDYNIDNSKLSPLIVAGKSIKPGTLISSTTNRENIVSNLDIGPTIMDFLGSTKNNMSGNVLRNIEKENNLENIIKENQRINTISKVRYRTLFYYVIFSIIFLVIPTILVMFKIKVYGKFKEIINYILTILLGAPSIFIIGSILKPISQLNYIINLILLLLLGAIIIWFTRKHDNQLLYISGFTIGLIVLDLILGGRISRYSVLSYDPIIGARYYGIGNELAGLFLGSLIIFSKELIDKFNNSYIPLIIFIIALLLIGNPNMGANLGGTLAFAIVITSYFIEILNLKLDYKRIFLIGIFIGLIIVLVGIFDIKFSKNTTHLGNTILLVKDKEFNMINDIFIRKILMNIKLIGTSFWTYLLLTNTFGHLVLFNHFENKDENLLKIKIAGIIGIMAGFILNDSGIILTAIAMNMITLELYIKTFN